MGREMFDRLVYILAPNPLFQSTGRKPQRHVKYQLATFLFRYGTLGSDAIGTAIRLSLGLGTVMLYCRRVTRALRELREQYAGYSNEDDQQASIAAIKQKSGFPRCVGSGDGSLIRHDEKPMQNGEQFKGRKQFFGVCTVFPWVVWMYSTW